VARAARIVTVADTGAIYALVDRKDVWHSRVVEWWARGARRIYLPAAILPEVCYLLQTRISEDAEIAFVKSVRDGEFDVVEHDVDDFARAHALMTTFRDLPLGYVDAMAIALAERVGAGEILTTDRLHFSAAPTRRPWALVP
jgi:predicted nucleic acid-binding protein